jgi:hypothetical protein
MPNFNKPAAAAQSPAQAEMPPKPAAKPASPPVVRPSPPPTGILGARTPEPTKQPAAEKKPSHVDNGPVLPLGAPRKKAPPATPPQP